MSRLRSERTVKAMEGIEAYLESVNHKLSNRIPTEHFQDMLKVLSLDKDTASLALATLRKDKGIKLPPAQRRLKKSTDIQECLAASGLYRGSSKQGVACKTIIDAILYKLPQNGKGMMIGTPGPMFCASPNLRNGNIFVDELMIAHILQVSTRKPISIVVGNAKDEDKAERKAQHWEAIDMLYTNTEVVLDKVDRTSFTHYVTKLAEHNDICVVVLLTSGVWNCDIKTMRKHELDMNFEEPAKRLTKWYRNLHILALCRNSRGSGYHVKYLHDGKEEILETPKEAYNVQ